MTAEVLHYTAFSDTPDGGNRAGVVLDAGGLSDAEMLAIAARVGYSETAFLTAGDGARERTLRYFSPAAEVDFCGHATIAAAVALGERIGAGGLLFHTPAGPVPVSVERRDGALTATLSSVPPRVYPVAPDDLAAALAALRWPAADLDATLPPRIAYAGVRHLVLAAGTRDRLAALDYDTDGLLALMRRLELTTLQLVWRESATVFHARDPFPVGGVVEDAATGAAAAAFGGYLRELGLAPADARLTIHQGSDMGRPSLLRVALYPGEESVRVTGAAVPIEPAPR